MIHFLCDMKCQYMKTLCTLYFIMRFLYLSFMLPKVIDVAVALFWSEVLMLSSLELVTTLINKYCKKILSLIDLWNSMKFNHFGYLKHQDAVSWNAFKLTGLLFDARSGFFTLRHFLQMGPCRFNISRFLTDCRFWINYDSNEWIIM